MALPNFTYSPSKEEGRLCLVIFNSISNTYKGKIYIFKN